MPYDYGSEIADLNTPSIQSMDQMKTNNKYEQIVAKLTILGNIDSRKQTKLPLITNGGSNFSGMGTLSDEKVGKEMIYHVEHD